jgi:hypothetical protein
VSLDISKLDIVIKKSDELVDTAFPESIDGRVTGLRERQGNSLGERAEGTPKLRSHSDWKQIIAQFNTVMHLLRNMREFTVEDVQQFQAEADKLFQMFGHMFDMSTELTQYMHHLCCGHVSAGLIKFKNISTFSQEAFEALMAETKGVAKRMSRGNGCGSSIAVDVMDHQMQKLLRYCNGGVPLTLGGEATGPVNDMFNDWFRSRDEVQHDDEEVKEDDEEEVEEEEEEEDDEEGGKEKAYDDDMESVYAGELEER